jgi:hypothetical protein
MIPPMAVHCGLGLLVTAAAIPLALRAIPMNRWYGIRIPKAFKSDRLWYDINAYGGKLLLIYGVLLVAFGIAAQDLTPSPTSLWMAPFTVGPLLGVFPILILINAYAGKLPEE